MYEYLIKISSDNDSSQGIPAFKHRNYSFREKNKLIRKWQADEDEKARLQSDILIGINKIFDS